MKEYGLIRLCVLICMILMSAGATFLIGKTAKPDDDSFIISCVLSSLLSGIFLTMLMWKNGII